MRLAALAIAGVMILTTEKLDVVVVLVEVEIEVAAALRAFQQAREYAGLLRDSGLFVARPFLERLHLFPSLAVNGLMDIEEDCPFFLRVFDPLFHLVGLGVALPLLTPTLFFVLIISLINSFQLFTQIMIMTPDGGPLGSTMVMVERIYKCGFRYYEMGTAAAYSWILFAILLLLTMVQMKLQNKWVNYDD